MTRRELILGVVLAGLMAAAALVSLSDDHSWIQLVVLALTPVILVSPHLFLDLFREGGSERVLERLTSPIVTWCFALSYAAVPIVVGAGVAGGVGTAVGGAVGLVLALQWFGTRRSLRRSIGLQYARTSDRSRRAILVTTALGLGALMALIAGFGYLLFGWAGVVVLVLVQAGALTVMLADYALTALRGTKDDAVDSGPPRSSS